VYANGTVVQTLGGSARSAAMGVFRTSDTRSFQVAAVDEAGNAGPTGLVQFKIDRTPPISWSTVSGTQGGGGWYTSSVTTLLSAGDPLSGLASVEYRIDGGDAGAWVPYGGTFPVTSDGTHTVEFRATDVAGNVEPTHSLEVKIDSEAPAVSIATPSGGAAVPGPSIDLTWSATDAGSGVSGCTVGIDGGILAPSSGPTSHTFEGVADGPHVLAVSCTDVAGNQRSSSVDFTVGAGSSNPFAGRLWPFLLLGIMVASLLILFFIAARRRRKEEPPPAARTLPPRTDARLPPPPPVEAGPPLLPLPPPPTDDPPPPPLPPPPPPL